MKTFLFFISIAMVIAFAAGCETPEGGSSLPWSQPEDWEHSMSGIGEMQ